ncbi:hypothetical protein NDU88_007215 [Pleurodeles waltl]|uniref:Uncharacterized protein n=1 Tax=Pleurodeles waltl TaxID=8319 RepID=A0AAV7NWR1_PLEWA|nr:hypothetical protein NDU88_007215 [Pleurodeles waltl]
MPGDLDGDPPWAASQRHEHRHLEKGNSGGQKTKQNTINTVLPIGGGRPRRAVEAQRSGGTQWTSEIHFRGQSADRAHPERRSPGAEPEGTRDHQEERPGEASESADPPEAWCGDWWTEPDEIRSGLTQLRRVHAGKGRGNSHLLPGTTRGYGKGPKPS